MKTNQEPIILAERAADYGRLRSVLRGWGYRESEIRRLFKVPTVDQKLEAQRKTTGDQSGKIPRSVS